jgi:ubiquinone/menaquinone biosynthesis C-methylase UbiE
MSLPHRFVGTSMPDRDWWQALWPDPTAVLFKLGIERGMSVLDLCCGDGYFTAPLSRLVRGRVVALDADPAMIERARAEVLRLAAPSPQWICADAMHLADYVEARVDCVLVANTLHGVKDRSELGRQVARVLASQGLLVVMNWHRKAPEESMVLGRPRGPRLELRMTPEDTRIAMTRAGFEPRGVVELPPHHYASTFRPARTIGPREATGR